MVLIDIRPPSKALSECRIRQTKVSEYTNKTEGKIEFLCDGVTLSL